MKTKIQFLIMLFTVLAMDLSSQTNCSNQQKKWYMNYYEIDFSSGTPLISPTPFAPVPTSAGKYLSVANGHHDAAGNLELYTVWIEQTVNTPERYELYNGSGTLIGSINNLHPFNREIEILPFECNGNNLFLLIYDAIVTNTSGNSLVYVVVDPYELTISQTYGIESAGFGNPTPVFALSPKNADGTYFLYSNIKNTINKYIIDFSLCQFSLDFLVQFDTYAEIAPGDISPSEIELSPDFTKLSYADHRSSNVFVIDLDGNGNSINSTQYSLPGGTQFNDRISGLEFNNDATKLFVSYISPSVTDGIYVLDINTGNVGGPIPNTSDYARSHLEMAVDCHLYAGNYFTDTNENRLVQIDPDVEVVTNSYLLPDRLPYQYGGNTYGVGEGIFTLPDQIDCPKTSCGEEPIICDSLVTKTFSFTFGDTTSADIALDGFQASNNEYVSLGFKFNFGSDFYYYFSRMDEAGNPAGLYQRIRIEDSGVSLLPALTEPVSPHHLIEGFDPANGNSLGYFAATTTYTDIHRILVMKIDHDGCVEWSKYIPAIGGFNGKELARGILQDEEGNLVVLVERQLPSGDANMGFYTFTPTGNALPSKDYPFSPLIPPDLNFWPKTFAKVSGLPNTEAYFAVAGTFEVDGAKEVGVYLLTKQLTPASPVIFRYKLQSNPFYSPTPTGIIQDGNDLVIGGFREISNSPDSFKGFLLKMTPFEPNGSIDGTPSWAKEYGYDNGGFSIFQGTHFLSLLQNKNGQYVIAASNRFTSGDPLSYLLQTDNDGNTNWIYLLSSASYAPLTLAEASNITLANDGGYFGVGKRQVSNPGQLHGWFYKTDEEGRFFNCDCQIPDSIPVTPVVPEFLLNDYIQIVEIDTSPVVTVNECLGFDVPYVVCDQYCPPFEEAPCCDSTINIISNGSFSGLTVGNLTGNLGEPWHAAHSSSPQINNNDGCKDLGSLQMWGNAVVGEGAEQKGLSFVAGYTYRISFCARYTISHSQAPSFSQVKIRASNYAVSSQSNCTTGGCEEVFVTSPMTDSLWHSFCIDEWTPQNNYDRITLSVINSSTVDDGEYVSWARIDNVCIELVDSSSCQATFDYSLNDDCGNLQFNDLSTPSGNIDTWAWNFDDPNSGSGNSSTQQNPTHRFSGSGSYNVCLGIVTTDSCTSTYCENVVVQFDNSTPAIQNCPPNMTIQCGEIPDLSILEASNSSCATFLNIECSRSDGLPINWFYPHCETVQVTCVATNDFGSNDCVFDVTTVDNVPPSAVCLSNFNVTLDENCQASISFQDIGEASSDNCFIVSESLDIENFGPQHACQNIPVTVTVTDCAGATDQCTTSVFVEDNTPPIITCPDNVQIDCNTALLPINTGFPTSTDNCTDDVMYDYIDEVNGSLPCDAIVSRTWKSTDLCGNYSECIQSITVADQTPPAISCPANITILEAASTDPSNTGLATGMDNCDMNLSIQFSDSMDNPEPCPEGQTITRHWTAVDDCSHIDECVQIIIVECDTITCCDPTTNLVMNGSFSGLPAGNLSPSSDDWHPAYQPLSSPQINNNDGCIASGSLQMWGNLAVGEGTEQDNLTLNAGYTYRISFCARYAGSHSLAPLSSQVRIRASNIGLNNQTDCSVNSCEEVFVTSEMTDSLWHSFCVEEWTPLNDYDRITLSVVNSNSVDNGDYTSWARIDDFCIELTATSSSEINYIGKIRLYPNPTSNSLTIEFDKVLNQGLKLYIVDIMGRTLQTQRLPKGVNRHQLDVANLSPAVYFIQLVDEDGRTWYSKFVKQ